MSAGNNDNEIFNIFHENADQIARLTDISSADYLEQLAPIVKESFGVHDNLDGLVLKLEDISQEKLRNLELICKQSEADILNSVVNISKIKVNSNLIQREIQDISQTLDGTGNKLIEMKKQYLNTKNNSIKINQAIDLTNLSLQLLELTNKVHDLIKKEKFFIALKNLADLKNVHIKNRDLSQFKFSQQIYQSIPILTDLIKQKSFENVKRLLVTLDKSYTDIGENLFSYTSSLIAKWNEKSSKSESLKEFSLNSPIEITLRLNETSIKLDPLDNEYIKIPLNPLYDAILIYESVNELPELSNRYSKEAAIRKDKIFFPVVNPSKDPFQDSSLEIFLQRLSAYFIVDSIINRNTRYKLKSLENSQSSFELIVDRLIPVVITHINKISEPDEMLELKSTFGLFVKLMENYGFATKKLYDEVLVLLFKKYQKLLLDNFEEEFKISLYEDDSMPMRINDLTLYKKVLAVSWYQTDNPDVTPISPINPDENKSNFPKHLPFSQLYPMTCAQIRSFVNKSLHFLEFNVYNKNFKLLSHLLITSLNDLMSSKIGKHLKEKVNSTNREEIAQNLINLDFFYISSFEVSKLLTSSNVTGGLSVSLIKSLPQKNFKLTSIDVFREIKKTAEDKLLEMVDSKVIQLIEMIDFDFESTIVNDEPSNYMIELSEFLKAMFKSTFSNLPVEVLKLLIDRTFVILTDSFKDIFKNTFTITDIAIVNFDSDLTYIENVMSDLTNGSRSRFEELRQIILLLKNGSFDELKNFKKEKYNRIDYEFALQLLNKLRINGQSINAIEHPGSPDIVRSPTSMNFSRFYKFRNPTK